MKRLGSEISLFTDRIGPKQSWQDSWLAFSNGRAALAWLLGNCGIHTTVSVCAYTCPSIPKFFRSRKMNVSFYDVGDEPALSRCIIVPALFGSPPWLKYENYAPLTIVDAAQTAFGHLDFQVPRYGAVLSCPRKCTEIADGAILALSGTLPAYNIDHLPIAEDAACAKMIARAEHKRSGYEWITWNEWAEDHWPETPHQMSNPSRAMLERLDERWHRDKRRENYRALVTTLYQGEHPSFMRWAILATVPFSLPIFVGNPDQLVTELKTDQIFLTRLWPDAEHDPEKHPNAAWMAKHLVSLPVDQRHDAVDMERVAKAVLAVAKPPPDPPEGMRRFVA